MRQPRRGSAGADLDAPGYRLQSHPLRRDRRDRNQTYSRGGAVCGSAGIALPVGGLGERRSGMLGTHTPTQSLAPLPVRARSVRTTARVSQT